MRPVFLALFCVLAQGFLPAQAVPAQPGSAVSVQAPAPVTLPRVRLETSYGPILLELEPVKAPKTVANFLAYVKAGHFAGTIFHRVIPGFMIQGGGMTEAMVEKPSQGPIPNEAALSGLKNLKGTLAMARTEDPDSAQAQFFINTSDNTSLDPTLDPRGGMPPGGKPGEAGDAVFGRVVEGMENVLKIEQVKTVWRRGSQNVPDYPVRIKSATLIAP